MAAPFNPYFQQQQMMMQYAMAAAAAAQAAQPMGPGGAMMAGFAPPFPSTMRGASGSSPEPSPETGAPRTAGASVAHSRPATHKMQTSSAARKKRVARSAPYSKGGKRAGQRLNPGRKLTTTSTEKLDRIKPSSHMDEATRREYHKQAEKKRRLKINELVQQLRYLLPNSSAIAFQKPTVFQHAAAYMRALKAHRTAVESQLASSADLLFKLQSLAADNASPLAAALRDADPSLADALASYAAPQLEDPDNYSLPSTSSPNSSASKPRRASPKPSDPAQNTAALDALVALST